MNAKPPKTLLYITGLICISKQRLFVLRSVFTQTLRLRYQGAQYQLNPSTFPPLKIVFAVIICHIHRRICGE
jgi:hypothetical protein